MILKSFLTNIRLLQAKRGEYRMDKKIMVTRSSMPDYEEYIQAIKPLWESHWLTNMGIYHQSLEKELTQYLNVEYLSLFVNGHLALELAIQAMNLEGEVITTPFTFISTTHAITRNGLTPVFCDISPDTYTIDVDKLESLITDKTSAIVPVHVYGNICNVERIDQIAKKHNLKVIYDAAHAFGVEFKGQGIGSFGDASMFSFHATKVFNTIEGGAICFHSEDYGKRLYQLKNFGIKNEEEVDAVGSNAKMNEFQALMGLCNLKHVNSEIEKRKVVVQEYRRRLNKIPGISFLTAQEDVKSNYAYFPIEVDKECYGRSRDALYEYLKGQGIFTRKYFYPLTNTFECYRKRYDLEATPVAKKVSECILTLPLYAELSKEDIARICTEIAVFAK